jgi:hypothetical protein
MFVFVSRSFFRPFRAGRTGVELPGLKPWARLCSPFGARSETPSPPKFPPSRTYRLSRAVQSFLKPGNNPKNMDVIFDPPTSMGSHSKLRRLLLHAIFVFVLRSFFRPFRAVARGGWTPRVKTLGFGSVAPSGQGSGRRRQVPQATSQPNFRLTRRSRSSPSGQGSEPRAETPSSPKLRPAELSPLPRPVQSFFDPGNNPINGSEFADRTGLLGSLSR